MKRIGRLYFHGSRKKEEVALTFDDGPSQETIKVLDLLKEYNAKATFFILGERIQGVNIK
jgi:peptidoglycan/xylan/chitin deacetylase (PgdA/CDA1 family)